MNYFDYINEVVKPQENKSLGFKFDTFAFNKKFRKAPSIDPDKVEIIREPFISKRDLIIYYGFSDIDSDVHLSIQVGFDPRGMCIDVGPIRNWDYSFWDYLF